MRMLIALLSSPPPALGWFLGPSAVLVFAYSIAGALPLPVEPVVVAVACVILFNASRTLGPEFRRLDADAFVKRAVIWTLCVTIGGLLWVNEPVWSQRVISVVLGLKAIMLTHALWRAPDDLVRLGGPDEGPQWFRDDWARWKVIALGLTVLVNEAAIRFATEAEWVAVMAVFPALAYCLLFWTLTALAWDREP